MRLSVAGGSHRLDRPATTLRKAPAPVRNSSASTSFPDTERYARQRRQAVSTRSPAAYNSRRRAAGEEGSAERRPIATASTQGSAAPAPQRWTRPREVPNSPLKNV